ncbi:hypothetical protein BS47DRAFT_612436 [Hydnum rufescens UP504]|uniref:Uncharacterized protein n=1 Tax=Hydnum rufescens UP504 TaxID=1448309 RepID=A0A9P6B366_9AGAM|nr:hypothetical protein BS47DRAFT_612436 [Hydnum rufescens UP504]
MLSTMTISNKGFQLERCEDLLETMIDLIEDEAFPSEEDDDDDDDDLSSQERRIWTGPQLLRQIDDAASICEPSLELRGPRQKPAVVILATLNLLRNLAMLPENARFISRNPRVLDVIARLSEVVDEGETFRPSSKAFELVDLLRIHHEVTSIIANLGSHISLSIHRPRTSRRLYSMLISPLVDPENIVKPLHPGFHDVTLPVPHIDMALDAFSRLAQQDANRKVLARVIPQSELTIHFHALVHMLPISEDDFNVTVSSAPVLDTWMGYLERLVQCIYNLIFLSPPSLKRTWRKVPGLTATFLRMIRFYLEGVRSDRATFAASQFEKNSYSVMARRAFEALSLLDVAETRSIPSPLRLWPLRLPSWTALVCRRNLEGC